MPTITVRSLGMNGDPLEGNGLNDFLSDIDAVGQIIGTRIKLFEGEWWENLQAGTPMFQSILGVENASQTQVISAILQSVINQTPYVLDIINLSCTYTPSTRALSFYAEVLTQFGTVVVSNGA
jgi:hypothetical protein